MTIQSYLYEIITNITPIII